MDRLSGTKIWAFLINHFPGAVAVFDGEMRYIACNKRWIDDFRLPQDDLTGCSHYDVFPEIGDDLKILHSRALAGEELSGETAAFQRRDGTLDWVRWKLAPWRDEAGAIGGVILLSWVMSDHIDDTVKPDVLASELDLLIDSANHHAIFLLDDKGCVRAWNSGAERMFNWTADEICGRPHTILFRSAGDDLFDTDLIVQVGLSDGRYHGSAVGRRKDKSEFTASVVVGLVEGRRHVAARYVVAVHDMSDELAQARAVEANISYHRAILESVPDAMITIDQNGSILWFSHTAEEMFGYRSEEVIGRNVSMLMTDADAARHEEYIANYKRTGKRRVIGSVRRVFGRRKDGVEFPHALFIGESNGGGRRLFTGFLRDLSQQEDAEDQVIPSLTEADSREGFPRRQFSDSPEQARGGLRWRRRLVFGRIIHRRIYGYFRGAAMIRTRFGGCWHWA